MWYDTVMLTRSLLSSFVPRTVERIDTSTHDHLMKCMVNGWQTYGSSRCQEARTRRFRNPLRWHGLQPKWMSTSGRNPAANSLSYRVRKILEKLMSSKVIIFKCSDASRMTASRMLPVNLLNRFTLTTIWLLRTGSDEEMMNFRCPNCLWCWSFIFEVSCATLWPIRKSQNFGDRFASKPWWKLEESSGCWNRMMEGGA